MKKTGFRRIKARKNQKCIKVKESTCQPYGAILKRPDHRKASAFQTQCPGSSVVEQWIENPRVGSSILPLGTIFLL